ncbi:MAG: rRNA maturation RNase YbeY [Denitrovibrio sp.]|nr:MAG: rRNA maturation RNase YbeY [Denitrovibrio sp.]
MDINLLITDEHDSGAETALFSACAEAVFSALEIGFESCEISLLITDDKRVKELNSQYRGKDTPTDVLSFPMSEDPFNEGGMLGDIAISYERAKEQAEEAAIMVERELAFLFIHGVLHLMGYEHENDPDEEEEMFDLQEEILRNLLENGKVP